ncbi:MAG: MarR family transcriptional regulator [Pseudonocardiales bacterium]|jgi:DNA-binding MarR family transcriptional regulator|nr:MarR family transcriptional regulator [Pseudonocardiales bacterium]
MAAQRADASASRKARQARRRRIAEAKQSLRELRIELAVLNHRVGSRIEIKDVDFDCLDVVTRHGPMSPTALARRIGVHLATMTGILDRLERGGWIVRDRDKSDRRAVLIRGVPDKQRDIIQLYDGMNSSLDTILETYSDDQIDLLVDFLRRCTEAGHSATEQLATDSG